MQIAIVNGPNHRRLGRRRAAVYGTVSADQVAESLATRAAELGVGLIQFQSNHEGALLDWLEEHAHEIDGVVCNPAGLTNYGLALRDCLDELSVPVAVVHVSNIHAREDWRRDDRFVEIADAYIVGCGWRSYLYALEEIVVRAADERARAHAESATS